MFKCRFQLKVIAGPGLGRVTRLDQEKITLGRARNPGDTAPGWVLLEEKAVSRQHAELSWRGEAYLLEHKSQTNATWVNGDPVTERLLAVGDQIRIGGVILELQPVEAEGKTAVFKEPVPAQPALPAPVAAPPPLPMRRKQGLALQVTSGPDQGQTFLLEGLFLCLGRGNQQLVPTKDDPRVFDQLVELSDPGIVANHLLLEWKELEEAYRAFKHPQAPPGRVKRKLDGLHWEAWLLSEPATLREGDVLTLGDTLLVLTGATPGVRL